VTMRSCPLSNNRLFSGSLTRFAVDIAESSGRCSIPITFPSGWTRRDRTCSSAVSSGHYGC
jgi:hypothetical protein